MCVPRWLGGLFPQRPLFCRLLPGRTAGARKRRRRPPPCLECLEERLTPSTFTVTNLSDTGAGSLRAAILGVNGDTDPSSVIAFAPAVTGTIDLQSILPDLSHNVSIDGPGANVLTVARGPAAAAAFNIFNVDPGVSATIIGLTISNGSAASGGGIFNLGTLVVEDAVVSGNSAANVGGGIANDTFPPSGSPSLTVINSTISSNTCNNAQGAAGIDSEAGTVLISNSTVSGNQAINSHSAGGVGIYGGSAAIDHSTIATNTASGISGGGLDAFGTSVTLFDTIVAGNSGGSGSDVQGTVISQGHNLIGNGDGSSGLTNGILRDQVGTAAAPIDPKLGALADNGGPTPTMALRSGSPAIDAGDNTNAPATDQRGFRRIFNGTIDIGAFEVQPPAVSTQAAASAGGVVGTAMLSDTATLADAVAPTGTITFTLKQPDGQTITVGSVTVNADGSYSAPPVPATEVGTYTWHASYSGDANNSAASDDGTNESVTTVKASPTIVAQANGTATAAGSVLSNTATLSGGFNVNGGTITFTLTAPDGTTTTEQVTVSNGDGAYSTPTPVPATQAGTYTWSVTYSGNATNNAATDKEVISEIGPSGILPQGSDASFTITVTNDGPADEQDVLLTDDVPLGATFVSAAQTSGPSFTLSLPPVGGTGTISASAATLPAGETAVFQVVLQAGPTTVSFTNTATVSSTTSGPGGSPAAVGLSSVPRLALESAGAKGLHVQSASWFTKFAVLVQLALAPSTVADGSPAGTRVGVVTVTTPLVGQFQPALFTLPAGEADNASFALAGSGGQELLAIQVPASFATKASYQIRLHVDIGVGDQADDLLVTVVNGVEHVTAKLVTVKVGKKKTRLMVEVLDDATGALVEPAFASPFQAPAYKRITVSVGAGSPAQIIVTARKGKRTVTRTFFV
jgi:uncharacterized repeat protein (TIGR01451 family)